MRHVLTIILMVILSFTACGKPLNIRDRSDVPVIIQVDSYKTARTHLFGELHYDNGIVTDVYCGETYDNKDGVGKGRIPNPELLNCEHSWPQSKFGKNNIEMKKVDLHHLYPATAFANSARSNHPFGEVDGPIVCGSAKKGIIRGTSITGFEPPDSHKGNVARAMFYFSTRYMMAIDPVQESYFRKWHKQDPIDSAERLRNQKIGTIQGWTNPFIDNPNLVDSIKDF